MRSGTVEVNSNNIQYVWIQFNYEGKVCLRAVTETNVLPTISSNTGSIVFSLRAPQTHDFPVYVWEAALPNEINEAIIGTKRIVVPSEYKKIALVGDTGCRPAQEATPDKWPLERIANSIANEKPNLIIHLGDMLYRHLTGLRKDNFEHYHPGQGDTWNEWEKEFFNPLSHLLPTTPWIFIRGNQENCDCAHEGWRRFLDGYPYSPQCELYTEPYVVTLDDLNLIVHDSSFVHPEKDPSWPIHQLANLKVDQAKATWLLTHRPLWGIVNYQPNEQTAPKIMLNEHGILQMYMQPFPDTITTVFSGHIHAFQFIKPSAYDINQFVIGNGGVALEEDQPPKVMKDTVLDDEKLEYALSLIEFGYSIALYSNNCWDLYIKNQYGKQIEFQKCSSRKL